MPFALNAVKFLADKGWKVDLHLWEDCSPAYEAHFPKNVAVTYRTPLTGGEYLPARALRRLERELLRRANLDRLLSWPRGYRCVLGLGQPGAGVAYAAAKSNGCPFIYFNDEFPSAWGTSIWSECERKAVQHAQLVVVPDGRRFATLREELGLGPVPHASLPNIPCPQREVARVDWKSAFDLPRGAKAFLHAGSIADWAQVPELLTTVPNWPDEAILIVHGRSSEGLLAYRRQLSHLQCPGKIFWTTEPLLEPELNSLVSYCTGSFALYRNVGKNTEFVGQSSGKLMRSIAMGSPVIASRLGSFEFVEERHLGVLVEHPGEIPGAVGRVIANRAAMSENALAYATGPASFARAWEAFREEMFKATGIDLG